MLIFTPVCGQLTLEFIDHPNAIGSPTLAMRVNVQFAEAMDPDDPRGGPKEKVSIEIDGIPVPYQHWTDVENTILRIDEIDENEMTEGSIYFHGYHNPLDVQTICFGQFKASSVEVRLTGTIDFTFEGLARLGKPDFDWSVELEFDRIEFDDVMRGFG